MNSDDVCRLLGEPTGGWKPLAGSIACPGTLGVYVLRSSGGEQRIGRLRGASDLIYIGRGRLSARLHAHRHVRLDLRDKGWLFASIGHHVRLEIGAFHVSDQCGCERDLLFQYFTEHLELPPANESLPKLTHLQITQLSMIALLGYEGAMQALKEEAGRRQASVQATNIGSRH